MMILLVCFNEFKCVLKEIQEYNIMSIQPVAPYNLSQRALTEVINDLPYLYIGRANMTNSSMLSACTMWRCARRALGVTLDEGGYSLGLCTSV
jgi:hypothetical protein